MEKDEWVDRFFELAESSWPGLQAFFAFTNLDSGGLGILVFDKRVDTDRPVYTISLTPDQARLAFGKRTAPSNYYLLGCMSADDFELTEATGKTPPGWDTRSLSGDPELDSKKIH